MANYYNITAWKHTGFNAFNRPYRRDVLAQSPFTDEGQYVQIDGVFVKRDEASGIEFFDVQGSVKDERGTLVNAPNRIGSFGDGGSWYGIEQFDYLRAVRTGYPGDEDFVDISGNMLDPWNCSFAANCNISYYFIIGLEPMARNVTRVYLEMDYWLTCGGPDELTIETGFKTRGHITEEADEKDFNTAPEPIALTYPLEVIEAGNVNSDISTIYDLDQAMLVASSTDLYQYEADATQIYAYEAAGSSGGTMLFPQVKQFSGSTTISWTTGLPGTVESTGGGAGTYFTTDYGVYLLRDSKVQNNISILYSIGQLELKTSFRVPFYYCSGGVEPTPGSNGYISTLSGNHGEVSNVVKQDIEESFPRKADYLYGQEVLVSLVTGDTDIQPFYNLNDDSVLWWAVLSPTGCPYARFKDIKDSFLIPDHVVKGMTWATSGIVLEGASGSAWNTIDNTLTKKEIALSTGQSLVNDAFSLAGAITGSGTSTTTTSSGHREDAIQGKKNGSLETVGKKISNTSRTSTSFSEESTAGRVLSGLQAVTNAGFDIANSILDVKEANISLAQANISAPYANFIPDIDIGMTLPNIFYVYIVNTNETDRQRLRFFFRQYGYSGLYEKLTWENIEVKEKVNYIEADNVVLRHIGFPQRYADHCASLLMTGVLFWNVRPDYSIFEDSSANPDKGG